MLNTLVSIHRHYKRASGALLVFDVSSRSSFENAEKVWLRELRNAADSNSSLMDCLVLVGNKIGESTNSHVQSTVSPDCLTETTCPTR